MPRDVFLCHASADKDALARPIFDALRATGLTVWFDEAEIHWGDSLTKRIQDGLSESRYVLVLLTPNFVAPGGNWRDEELQAALAEQIASGVTRVLPIVYGVAHDELRKHLPFVAARRYERIDAGSPVSAIADRVRQRMQEPSQPLLLTRNEVARHPAVGTVEERLARATKEVWVSGNDNMFVARAEGGFILRALERGIRIRILCVDPESAAADMLSLIDPRFPTKEFFQSEVRSVEKVLREWAAQYAGFEWRYLPILPATGYFITDPGTPHETVKLELYTAKPWAPLESRPHLILGPSMTEWRRYFIQQYENYWRLSDPAVRRSSSRSAG